MAIESKMSREPLVSRQSYGQPQESPPKKKSLGWVIAVIIVFALGIGIWVYQSKAPKKDILSELEGGSGTAVSIGSGEYQAVFLDNGQVYFGHLKTKGESYTLTDVYYLQSGAAGVDQAANLSLTKLGNEAHGPEDRMEINKDHVLFVEDMKADSKVIQAIKQHKSTK